MAEHLGHVKVEGLHAVALTEGEMGVASRLTDHIERSTLALGNLAHMVDVFFINEQAHAFLALIGNNLFAGERLVTDGQLRHINLTATLLDQFAEAVQVTCRAVVVDRNDGVHILLA